MSTKENLLNMLRQKKYKITFAESCTGGALSSEMVSIPGSSEVFEYGFITYSKESKINILNVDASTINTHGVVSQETAKEMVLGAIEKSGADIGISVTGCAGPGRDSDGNAPGTVCFAFYVKGITTTEEVCFQETSRNDLRKKAVIYAFNKIYSLLEKN